MKILHNSFQWTTCLAKPIAIHYNGESYWLVLAATHVTYTILNQLMNVLSI